MNDNNDFGLTELMAVAVQMHELYSSYVDAGFTEDQAMNLLSVLIKTSLERGQTDSE